MLTEAIAAPFSSKIGAPTATVPEFPITTLLLAVLAAVSLLLVIGKSKLTIIKH
jgi:hypothetical protein